MLKKQLKGAVRRMKENELKTAKRYELQRNKKIFAGL